ncbi:MAG: hypothetical protein ACREFQ_02440 [Stellaceae bacterium]
MDAALRQKLAKLVALLASSLPGEREAAVDAIGRALKAAGNDIHALAAIVAGDDEEEIEPPRGGGMNGAAAGMAVLLFEALRQARAAGLLRPSEARFVASCEAQWIERAWLSAKQITILKDMIQRARARRSAA